MPSIFALPSQTTLADTDVLVYGKNPAVTPTASNVTAAIARAYFRADQVINVKDPAYGAKGDGTTDDTTAIQAAFTAWAALPLTSALPIYFPPGIYKCGTLTPISQINLKVFGAGYEKTWIQYTGSTVWLSLGTFTTTPANPYVGTAQDYQITDLTLSSFAPGGNNDATEGSRVPSGIQDNGSGGALIQRVYFKGFKYGFAAPYGSDFSALEDCLFGNCDVAAYLGPNSQQFHLSRIRVFACMEGVVFENPGQGSMDNCWFVDQITASVTFQYSTATRFGLNFIQTGQGHDLSVAVSDCWFEGGAGFGTTLHPSPRFSSRQVWVTGNHADTSYPRHVKILRPYFIAGGPTGTNCFMEITRGRFIRLEDLLYWGSNVNVVVKLGGSVTSVGSFIVQKNTKMVDSGVPDYPLWSGTGVGATVAYDDFADIPTKAGDLAYSVKAWGTAKGDTKVVTDGVIAGGSLSTLTCATSTPFVAGDTGKQISVVGAGAAGVNLITTIASVTSSSVVQLTAAASTAVSAATVVFGSDDTAAFTAVKNAAGVNGKVFVPAGRYIINYLILDVAGQTWEFHPGAEMRTGGVATSDRLLHITGDDVTIHGGTFDMTGSLSTMQAAPLTVVASGVTFRNVTVKNSGPATNGAIGYNACPARVRVEGCRFVTCRAGGLLVNNNGIASTDVIITNNFFDGTACSALDTFAGISLLGQSLVNPMSHVVVTGNIIRMPVGQVSVQNTGCIGAFFPKDAVFANNVCEGTVISMSIASAVNTTVANNTIRNFQYVGIELPAVGGTGATQCVNVTVTGNTLDAMAGGGNAVANVALSVPYGVNGLSFTGNTVRGLHTPNTAGWIQIGPYGPSVRIAIADNVFYNSLNYSMEAFVLFGPNAAASLAGLSVTGNVFDAGSRRQVTDGAITTGTATFTSATAAFTAADAGASITVNGAGPAAATLSTYILSYTNATTVTLAANAGTTVSGATAIIGAQNVRALQIESGCNGVVIEGNTVTNCQNSLLLVYSATAPMTQLVIGYNAMLNSGPPLVVGNPTVFVNCTSPLIRSLFGDSNFTAQFTDRVIAENSVLTAPRVVTLPAASAVAPGTILQLVDETATATGTNTLSWARAGSDTINGGTANVVAVNTARGNGKIMSDGTSNWTIV